MPQSTMGTLLPPTHLHLEPLQAKMGGEGGLPQSQACTMWAGGLICEKRNTIGWVTGPLIHSFIPNWTPKL